MSEADLVKITERIDAICTERPSHKEVLEFLNGVIADKLKAKQDVQVDPINIDEKLLEVKNKEGFPLIDKKDLRLDVRSASHLFTRLCERLKGNERVSKDIDRISQAVENEEIDLEEVFEKAAAEDREYMGRMSDRLGLENNILFFLAENSIQPIFEMYAVKLKNYVNQEQWWRGYCPICGSKPVMAELIGVEKKKFLICSCCGYEWRYSRSKCPFCEKADPKGLKYFLTEKEGKAYRVETCRKCRKYIKTVDTEELDEEFIPLVEDIGTLYLDVLAKKEGYTREVHPLGLNFADL